MGRFALSAFISAFLCVTHQVQAQAPRQIAGWTLDSSGKSCALYQTIDGRFVLFALAQDGSGVLRAHDKRWKLKSGQPAVLVLPGETPLRIEGVVASTSNGWSGVVASGGIKVVERLSKSEPATLAVESRGTNVASTQFQGLGEAVPYLIDCAYKLPPAQNDQDPIARGARLTTAPTISRKELPSNTKRLNEFVFRLVVGVDGSATDCQIIQSTGSNEADLRACVLLKQRTHFEPAVGASGKPVATTFQSRILFR